MGFLWAAWRVGEKVAELFFFLRFLGFLVFGLGFCSKIVRRKQLLMIYIHRYDTINSRTGYKATANQNTLHPRQGLPSVTQQDRNHVDQRSGHDAVAVAEAGGPIEPLCLPDQAGRARVQAVGC